MTSQNSRKDETHLEQMFTKNLLKLSAEFLSLEMCTNKKVLDYGVLKKLQPKFCSIPWLPDSNAKVEDVNSIPAILLAEKLKSQGHTVVLHLGANDLNRKQIETLLEKIKLIGLRHILAVQGDFSDGKSTVFPHAKDLVAFIKQTYGDTFCVGVAGYPDKHPTAESLEIDLQRLKEKVDSGAEFIISQAISNFDTLLSFHDKCRKLNINVPIIPGVFVVHSYDSLKMMSKICKISIPDDIKSFVEENKDDPNAIRAYGIGKAANVIKKIFESHRFSGVHIFTLNHLDVMQELYNSLEL